VNEIEEREEENVRGREVGRVYGLIMATTFVLNGNQMFLQESMVSYM
jgi:hypothetical protein